MSCDYCEMKAAVIEELRDEIKRLKDIMLNDAADAMATANEQIPPGHMTSPRCQSKSPYTDGAQCEGTEGHDGLHSVVTRRDEDTW